jgi:membrane-associated phospholipid phosphatase
MACVQGPLIDRGWRRPAAVAAVVGLAVFLVLAVLLFHGTRTTFDSWVFRVLPPHISAGHNELLLGFTEPSVSVLLLALTLVLALSARRYDLAVLAALGPALGTVLASDIAKPIIHRTLFGGAQGTFPSGHETGVTCTATVLLVAFGQLPLRRAARCALVAVLAAWVVISAVALTRFYYHYATDTIGAIGLSVAFVLGSAALLDRYWPRRRRRPLPRVAGRPRPRPAQLTPRS